MHFISHHFRLTYSKINNPSMVDDLLKTKSLLATSRAELSYSSDPEQIKQIEAIASNAFELSSKAIKGVKSKSLKDSTAAMQFWSDLKWDAYDLRDKAIDKFKLLENRQQLFGSTHLPENQNFELIIQDCIKENPEFKRECEHFKYVLSSCMRISNVVGLTINDIHQLELFLLSLKRNSKWENSEIFHSVEKLVRSLNESLKNKKVLLENLSQSVARSDSSDTTDIKLSENSQIKLLVNAEQILKNPFEPRFVLSELVHDIKSDKASSNPLKRTMELISDFDNRNTKSSSGKDFWDNASELERQANQLANTPEKMKWLLECKNQGLKDYLVLQQKKTNSDYLIVGAGPAGLIRAIYLSMKNIPFQIIEKRAFDKTPRMNTVTLGIWEPKELEILHFLGTLSILKDKISFGHNRAFCIEVALGDLEKALEDTLGKLNHNRADLISYTTEVESIKKNEDGTAQIRMINIKTNETSEKSPSGVFVVDGSSGTTRQLLGVAKDNLSKTSSLSFSIFKKDPKQKINKLASLKYRILNAVKGVFIAIKILLYSFVFRTSKEQAYIKTMIDGPSGLSRVASHDYLLRIFRKEESEVMGKLKNEITQIKMKIKRNTEKNTEKSLAKVKVLEEKRGKLENALVSRLEKKAKNIYGRLDFIHQCFNPKGHRMNPLPMKHQQSLPVDVVISKAERSLVKVGKTLFFLRGDACHTTDPFTGSGCKTALEETLADQYFINDEDHAEATDTDLSILNWGQNHYQQKQIDQTFLERVQYFVGSERPIRFTDLAVMSGFITSNESLNYLRLVDMQVAKDSGLNIVMNEEDRQFCHKLVAKLQGQLKKVLADKNTTLENFTWNNAKLNLSSGERKLLLSNLKNALNSDISKVKHPVSRDSRLLFAKLCCSSCPEGWLLNMIVQLSNNLGLQKH